MSDKPTFHSLKRVGAKIYLTVRGRAVPGAAHYVWRCADGHGEAEYTMTFFGENIQPCVIDISRLVRWVRYFSQNNMPVTEIIEHCSLQDTYCHLSQKHPLEMLEMLASLEAALTT